jgi:hypothetical protein
VRSSQANINSPSTLKIKLKLQIDQVAYQPIPQILLPADHALLLDEWTEDTTQDGTAIQRMSVRPGVLLVSLRPCTIPMIFSNEIWGTFIGEIDNILEAKIRQKMWDHQSDISRLNTHVTTLQGDLALSKNTELQATQHIHTSSVEAGIQMGALRTDSIQSLQKAKDEYAKALMLATTRGDKKLNKARADRDSFLAERDEARSKATGMESKLLTVLAQLKHKGKTIKSLLKEKRLAAQAEAMNAPTSVQQENIPPHTLTDVETQPGPSHVNSIISPDHIAREVSLRLRQRELDERERLLSVNFRETTFHPSDSWADSRHSPY